MITTDKIFRGMIIVTKDNREYRPLLFGSIDTPEPSEYITCISNADEPEFDMFGKILHHKIHISNVKCFKGSLITSPVVFPKYHQKLNNGQD